MKKTVAIIIAIIIFFLDLIATVKISGLMLNKNIVWFLILKEMLLKFHHSLDFRFVFFIGDFSAQGSFQFQFA